MPRHGFWTAREEAHCHRIMGNTQGVNSAANLPKPEQKRPNQTFFLSTEGDSIRLAEHVISFLCASWLHQCPKEQ